MKAIPVAGLMTKRVLHHSSHVRSAYASSAAATQWLPEKPLLNLESRSIHLSRFTLVFCVRPQMSVEGPLQRLWLPLFVYLPFWAHGQKQQARQAKETLQALQTLPAAGC